jgi:hypothetical protein
MLPQEREELRSHETIVPNFDGVTKPAGDANPGPGSSFEFIIMFLPKVCRFTRVTRQQLEKLIQALLIPGKNWGAIAKELGRVFPEERVRKKQKSLPVALRHRAVFSCA